MNKLFIIDMMPLMYKGHFVFLRNPRMTASGINTSALLGLANGLLSILRNERPSHAVIAMDPGAPTFRHEAYPAYKAQRQKMPEDLSQCIPYAFELLEALKIPVVRVEGFEADDVMGTLAVKGVEAGFDVYMATPDKDAAQLVRPGVRLYRPARSGDAAEIYDEQKVCEKWSIKNPLQMIDYLALAGDSSDNIPGIRGVGEKTAIDLISRFGGVEEIIANAGSIAGKLSEKVAAGAEDARLSKFLSTIRTDVPIDPVWETYRLDGVDKDKLAVVCEKFELNRLAKEFLGSEDVKSSPKTTKNLKDVAHEYVLVTKEDEAQALLEELMKSTRIAFDTETSGVDAANCKLVGFSFSNKPGKAWYVAAELIDVFRPLFADPSKILIAHNVKFDRAVLHRCGIGFASTPHDTMLAHYCLDASARHGMDALSEQYLNYSPIPITDLIGERVRGKEQLSMAALKPEEILDYAAEDADVTLRLYEVMQEKIAEGKISKALLEVEQPLVKVLLDMEREGVRVDGAALKEFGAELDRETLGYQQEILKYAGPGFNPDSPKQLGQLLFGKLALEGGKKTSSGQFATDEKTLSRLVDRHPVVNAILEYRACTKLKSTYVEKLLSLADDRSRVHTTYNQAFTETGRISSENPNLQNIPIRTQRGRNIRRAFVPRDENHVILAADYSQIELRIMAAMSGDEAMLEAFRNGEDIHRDTASRVFGVMPLLVSPEQRNKCKMVNFGIIYGISPFGLSQRLKISRKEASELIDVYFKMYPGVRKYMDQAVESARAKGYAETILGRRRVIRDINSRNLTQRQSAERDAINTPIQGSAADLIKMAMVNIDRAMRQESLKAKMVLQIHDELVFDVPKNEVGALEELVRREMIQAYDFGVPLEVSVGTGANWLEAH